MSPEAREPGRAARLFLPNRAVDRTSMLALSAAWVVASLLVWAASPWRSLPGPREVLGAFGDLWWHHGLGPREVPAEGRLPDATIGGRGYEFAMVAVRRVDADVYVENGSLTIGGDEDLAFDVLRSIRVFG